MTTPTVVDTIEALAKARAVVELDDRYRLVVFARRPLDGSTAELVRQHRVELAWAVLGRRSGHEWLACDRCGKAQLVEPEKAGRLCHMKPGCRGHLRRSVRRLLDPRIAAAWRHKAESGAA